MLALVFIMHGSLTLSKSSHFSLQALMSACRKTCTQQYVLTQVSKSGQQNYKHKSKADGT